MPYRRGGRYRKSASEYGRERAAAHVREAEEFADQIGGADGIVKDAFFALSGKSLTYLLDKYEELYGYAPRQYAQKTISKWQSGDRRMSGIVAKRLFKLMPPLMPTSQKHLIVEKVWKRYGPHSQKYIYVGPDTELASVLAEIQRYVESLTVVYAIPANLERQFDWLSDNDVTVKQQLLNYFMDEQRKAALASIWLNVPMILEQLSAEHAGQISKLSHTVFVGNHRVEIIADPLRTGYELSANPIKPTKPPAKYPFQGIFIAAGLVLLGVLMIGNYNSGHSGASQSPVQKSGTQSVGGAALNSGSNSSGSSNYTTTSTESTNVQSAAAPAEAAAPTTQNVQSAAAPADAAAPTTQDPPTHVASTLPPIPKQVRKSVTKTAVFQDGCSDSAIAAIDNDGGTVRLSNGTIYTVSDDLLMRTYAASWSTGDPITVCLDKQSGIVHASLQGSKGYQKIQATLSNSTSPSQVSCGDTKILQVIDGGSTVQTTDGYSYQVSSNLLMRTYAASWSTGDAVTVCRTRLSQSDVAASVQGEKGYQKIQTTLYQQIKPASVACREALISSVGDGGASVATTDGRSYDVSQDLLMRTYANSWSTHDSVTVCEARAQGGLIAASLQGAKGYQKIQATRS